MLSIANFQKKCIEIIVIKKHELSQKSENDKVLRIFLPIRECSYVMLQLVHKDLDKRIITEGKVLQNIQILDLR